MNLLKKSVHSRIVNVSSEAHRIVNVYDLKAITTCQSEFRSHFIAYGVSKLALVLFTKELSKKLKSKDKFKQNSSVYDSLFFRYKRYCQRC